MVGEYLIPLFFMSAGLSVIALIAISDAIEKRGL